LTVRILDIQDQDLPAGTLGGIYRQPQQTGRQLSPAPNNARAVLHGGLVRQRRHRRTATGCRFVVLGRDKDLMNRGGEIPAGSRDLRYRIAGIHMLAEVSMPPKTKVGKIDRSARRDDIAGRLHGRAPRKEPGR
jgi:non-ribosomal peptide synthetase component E (peptide arylation enzyme)